jgi:hypothetical protein
MNLLAGAEFLERLAICLGQRAHLADHLHQCATQYVAPLTPRQSSRGGNDLPLSRSRRLRVLIDFALRELRKRFVGLLFLAECRIQ